MERFEERYMYNLPDIMIISVIGVIVTSIDIIVGTINIFIAIYDSKQQKSNPPAN